MIARIYFTYTGNVGNKDGRLNLFCTMYLQNKCLHAGIIWAKELKCLLRLIFFRNEAPLSICLSFTCYPTHSLSQRCNRFLLLIYIICNFYSNSFNLKCRLLIYMLIYIILIYTQYTYIHNIIHSTPLKFLLFSNQ